MADALHGSIDAVEQDVLVLGLVLLKYISDAFVDDVVEIEGRSCRGLCGRQAMSCNRRGRDG
jgi:hypothetical protein